VYSCDEKNQGEIKQYKCQIEHKMCSLGSKNQKTYLKLLFGVFCIQNK